MLKTVQSSMRSCSPICTSVSLLLKVTSLTLYFTSQSKRHFCRLEFSFQSTPEPASCMTNPCFDGVHAQTETLSGLLVREGPQMRTATVRNRSNEASRFFGTHAT